MRDNIPKAIQLSAGRFLQKITVGQIDSQHQRKIMNYFQYAEDIGFITNEKER